MARTTRSPTAATIRSSCARIPDRLVPLDVMRDLEREGVIGELHEEFISTSGLSNPLSNTRRMGREMASQGEAAGHRRDHSDFNVRHQHSQRRCDHYGIGKGRYSHGADYRRVARGEDGRRQSVGARQRHRPCGGRCQGTRKRTKRSCGAAWWSRRSRRCKSNSRWNRVHNFARYRPLRRGSSPRPVKIVQFLDLLRRLLWLLIEYGIIISNEPSELRRWRQAKWRIHQFPNSMPGQYQIAD